MNTLTKKKNQGFTLAEMVTTVAIIGTLSAIAIPNYLRIKMNVNMEMVKQHLRIIGTHMNDLYNQNKSFPQDILSLGNSGEEVAITASLNAIDRYGYTGPYLTDPNRSIYTLRKDPKPELLGISGDKCFFQDSTGTREINCWDGAGVAMIDVSSNHAMDDIVTRLTQDPIPPLSRARQAEVLAAYLELNAYASSLNSGSYPNFDQYNALPATSFLTNGMNAEDTIKDLFPEISQILKSKGIDAYFASNTTDGFVNIFSIGFKLADPVTSRSDLDTRGANAQNTYTTFNQTGQ